MAIEVEDGTGKAAAVSYVAVATATAYFEARGVETWAEQETATQEAALVRATASLDAWLRGRWFGKKKTQAQALAWPRTDVSDEDGYEVSDTTVPVPVWQATCEIALIELTERFIQQSVSRDNTIASESVGPISVSYRADTPTIKTYPHIDAMLKGLAAVGGVQIGMHIGLTATEEAALQDEPLSIVDLDDYLESVKWG